MVKIDIENKINFKNFTTILSMIESVDKIESTDLNTSKKMLNGYCNLVSLKNINPNTPIVNLNIEMKGKYNIIELIDIPKGELNCTISNNYDLTKTLEDDEIDEEIESFSNVDSEEESDGELLSGNLSEEAEDKFLDDLEDGEIVEEYPEVDEEVDDEVRLNKQSVGERYSRKFLQNKKINFIMKKLTTGKSKSDVLHIKDRKTNKVNIENIPLEKAKLIYLENIRNRNNENEPLEINLSYSHGRLVLVLDKINAKLKITNNSNQFERCSMFENKKIIQEVEEERLVEGFDSSNYYCTSGGEIVIILIIIYLVYRAMTAPEIIKIFR